MKNRKLLLVLAFALVGLLAAGAAGVGMWWWQQRATQAHAPAMAKVDENNYKYISLDKVIVMLRGSEGQPVSHYLAVDLVFKTREAQEKTVKEHLPLLRSVAVKSLSAYTMDKAGMMTIDQFAAEINRAFVESYKREQREQPFTEAMIGKLIIE